MQPYSWYHAAGAPHSWYHAAGHQLAAPAFSVALIAVVLALALAAALHGLRAPGRGNG